MKRFLKTCRVVDYGGNDLLKNSILTDEEIIIQVTHVEQDCEEDYGRQRNELVDEN